MANTLIKTDMEKMTFEPTVRHYTLLRYMDDQTKAALKLMINTLGYYSTISVLISECGNSNNQARTLADIGCYMLEDYE
jgi:hypothetical protein